MPHPTRCFRLLLLAISSLFCGAQALRALQSSGNLPLWKMTVLITGGAGFLGQRLARAVLRDQHTASGASEERPDSATKLLLVDNVEPVGAIPGAQHVSTAESAFACCVV